MEIIDAIEIIFIISMVNAHCILSGKGDFMPLNT